MPESAVPDPAAVDAVRAFNRFYTPLTGVLDERAYDSPFTMTQVRLLFELAHRDGLTARVLAAELALDPGHLSRLLKGFEQQGLVARTRAATDAREKPLRLTDAGRQAIAPLMAASARQVGARIGALPARDVQRLLGAMATIRTVLQDGAPAGPDLRLREHGPGDIGWVVSRHGALYGAEYGWDLQFEALVAEIAARFLRRFDPMRERAWIAELNGERAGCAFIVRQSRHVAKLRLVLVEPWARGHGIGRRLVDEAIGFSRACGYRRLVLWTNDCLHAARAIYVAAGFRLERSEPHRSFGHDLVGQYWSLDLTTAVAGDR